MPPTLDFGLWTLDFSDKGGWNPPYNLGDELMLLCKDAMSDACWRCRRCRRGAVITLLTVALCGCAPATIDLFEPVPVSTETPEFFDDRNWATVLRENVRSELVDYDHLASHDEPLTRYLQLIAQVGPESTPEFFKDSQFRLAYYINAYNAGVLRAVLHEKAPETMYATGKLSLDYRYRLRVDGRLVTLHDLRAAARAAGDLDARVEFALCGAAMGCPPLSDQPFRPDTLSQHLERLAHRAMELPQMVRIDHQRQRLLIGLPVSQRREDFLTHYRKLTGVSCATLLNVLLQMADGVRREWLNTAVGYREGIIPFQRKLNRWSR